MSVLLPSTLPTHRQHPRRALPPPGPPRRTLFFSPSLILVIDSPFPSSSSLSLFPSRRRAPRRVKQHDDDEVYDWLEEVTLVEGGTGHTCKLSSFSDAWGLPHVLRACDREGLTDVKALLRAFPPGMYPSPTRVPDRKNPACTRQSLMSLQEGCMHRRAWQGAPARVGLRYDVLVEVGGWGDRYTTFVSRATALAERAREDESKATAVCERRGMGIAARGNVRNPRRTFKSPPASFERACLRLRLSNYPPRLRLSRVCIHMYRIRCVRVYAASATLRVP